MNIVFNKDVISLRKRIMHDSGSICADIIETFGTEYGVFIPVTSSGFQFLRWLKRGGTDKLPETTGIVSHFIHIANDGEINVMTVDSNDDFISVVPYYSKTFAVIGMERDTSEALNYLIRNCKTVNEAVKIVDSGNMDGIHDPNIFFASDWVAHAKEKGYTQIFYHTSFSSLTK